MEKNKTNFEYDITLSFAGEDRVYVEKVASLLKSAGVKVFYDKNEEADLWGKDLGIHFDTIYRKSARYCVPFISEHYKKKIWTNYEIRTIISRSIEQNSEYILPVRFDDTEIEGLRPTISYVDLRYKTPEQLVDLILMKLGGEHTTPIAQIFQETRNDVLRITIYHSFMTSSFGIQPNGPILKLSITNTLKGDYRYFYEPSFRLTIPLESGANAFWLTNVKNEYKYPIKLEYGQEIEIKYELSSNQLEVWGKFDKDCEFYAICSTTIGEIFESNKENINSIINAFEY